MPCVTVTVVAIPLLLLSMQVAPVCKASFIECGGVNMLLDSLTAASSTGTTSTTFTNSSMGTKSPSRSAAGQALASYHSSSPVGGRASAAAAGSASSCGASEPALRSLRRLLQEDAAMAAAVVDRGGVQVLLQLLQAPAAATLTSVRQGVLLCLSELCSAGGRAGTTAVRAADGVPLLLKECQRWVVAAWAGGSAQSRNVVVCEAELRWLYN